MSVSQWPRVGHVVELMLDFRSVAFTRIQELPYDDVRRLRLDFSFSGAPAGTELDDSERPFCLPDGRVVRHGSDAEWDPDFEPDRLPASQGALKTLGNVHTLRLCEGTEITEEYARLLGGVQVLYVSDAKITEVGAAALGCVHTLNLRGTMITGVCAAALGCVHNARPELHTNHRCRRRGAFKSTLPRPILLQKHNRRRSTASRKCAHTKTRRHGHFRRLRCGSGRRAHAEFARQLDYGHRRSAAREGAHTGLE
jgi:hypothetical protein